CLWKTSTKEKETDMKKYLLALGVAALILTSVVSAAFAADENAFTKFGRGLANIATSPGELYTQPILLMKDQAASTAIFGGLLKGTAMFVAREFVGIYEVLTFPFPVPKGYRPIIEPATTFTDWDTRKPQV
ncbi:MAG: exosortase system-associated protein, TIGR04073 family, partial [Candidatus Omnitrophota bacterium]